MSKRAVGTVFQRSQDGRWVVRLTLPNGKRVTRYADSREAGERLLATMLTDPATAAPAPYTVSTWLDEFLIRDAKGKAASTAKDRANLAKKIKSHSVGRVRLDKLTPAQVQHWCDQQQDSHRNRLKRLQLFRAALDQAMILGHVQRNAAAPIRIERQPVRKVAQAWTKAERDHFLSVNEQARHYLMWKLGLHTGTRPGELIALRVEDYNSADRTLHIQRTIKTSERNNTRREVGPPKTPESNRIVPLSRTAQAVIEAQLQRRTLDNVPSFHDEGWLFPNTFGGILAYDRVLLTWKEDVARAGVKYIRMHDMRTTFISLSIRYGVKAEVVAKIVGHKDPTITLRIYRQVYQDEMEDVRDLLDAI